MANQVLQAVLKTESGFDDLADTLELLPNRGFRRNLDQGLKEAPRQGDEVVYERAQKEIGIKYESEFTPTFLKLLKELDRPIKERITKTMRKSWAIREKSHSLYLQKSATWWIGDYRIIYTVDDVRQPQS
jgi:mRNA-degrading endonuclease RelE of RelBE toxin-antitoxin system